MHNSTHTSVYIYVYICIYHIHIHTHTRTQNKHMQPCSYTVAHTNRIVQGTQIVRGQHRNFVTWAPLPGMCQRLASSGWTSRLQFIPCSCLDFCSSKTFS